MKFLSSKTHVIIGLIVGAVLVVAPWLLDFVDIGGAAVLVPILVGLFIIVSELTTTSPISPLKLVPMRVHLMMDVATGLFLALSPWLFDFADEPANAWVPHLVVGLLVVGYALVTSTDDAV